MDHFSDLIKSNKLNKVFDNHKYLSKDAKKLLNVTSGAVSTYVLTLIKEFDLKPSKKDIDKIFETLN